MIPKILHYTWFSGEPFPENIKMCIDSWKRHFPDWEFRLWDMAAIESLDYDFLKEAIAARKWAYASDFVRLWAVVHHGGVYLDTDVLVFKPFDDLLSDKAFIGKEYSWHLKGRTTEVYLSAHCFGAEKDNAFFKRCLDYYCSRHFILTDNTDIPNSLRYDMNIAPYVYAEIAKQSGYDPSAKRKMKPGVIDGDVKVYPCDRFDPKEISSDSYCKHLAVGSWRDSRSAEPEYTLKYKIMWRVWKAAEIVANKFSRTLVEIN